MARWRVPSNAIFRASSSRGIPRLEYAPQHEWDPQRITAVAGMVSNVNKAATGVMGIRPLDAITAGISRLAAPAAKKGGEIRTGADLARRAALARAGRGKVAGAAPTAKPAAPAPAADPSGRRLLAPPTGDGPAAHAGVVPDLSSIGDFDKARRIARSTYGVKHFLFGGTRYSTIGYEDRMDPRSKRQALESDASWLAALERARKRGVAPGGGEFDPTPLYPEERGKTEFDALTRMRSERDQAELSLRPELQPLLLIASDPKHPEFEQARMKLLEYPDGRAAVAFLDERLKRDAEPLERQPGPGLIEPAPAPPAPAVPTPPAPPGYVDVGKGVDPDVIAARERERERAARIVSRGVPEEPAMRSARLGTLGEALNAGRIIAPEELPTNLQDLRVLAQVVTDRSALMRIMRQARESSQPKSFADLFTGAHERRDADLILKAFTAGERMRLSPAQVAQIQQRQARLGVAAGRLEQGEAGLKIKLAGLKDKLANSRTLREKRHWQTETLKFKLKYAMWKADRKMRRLRGRRRPGGGRWKYGTFDEWMKAKHPNRLTVGQIQQLVADGKTEQALKAAKSLDAFIRQRTTGRGLKKSFGKGVSVLLGGDKGTSGVKGILRSIVDSQGKKAKAIRTAPARSRAVRKLVSDRNIFRGQYGWDPLAESSPGTYKAIKPYRSLKPDEVTLEAAEKEYDEWLRKEQQRTNPRTKEMKKKARELERLRSKLQKEKFLRASYQKQIAALRRQHRKLGTAKVRVRPVIP